MERFIFTNLYIYMKLISIEQSSSFNENKVTRLNRRANKKNN